MCKKNVKCSLCNNELSRYQTKTDTYFCNNECKSKWQVKQRENLGFTKEWLINQYFELGKDCNQIAKEIGRDGKSIWNWFKGYGIKINKRGYNYEKNLCLDGSVWIGRNHSEETRELIRQKSIEDGRVPYLKNGKHWLHEVAKDSHPNWKGGISPERQILYATPEWMKLAIEVWSRDNNECQKCKRKHKKSERAFHIHHIIPFKVKEHRMELDNMVLLCHKCHMWVHSKKNINKIFIKNDQ